MLVNTELNALLQLLDDPDEQVYASVSNKLITYGKQIVPNLEQLWEETLDPNLLLKIEFIINKLLFADVLSAVKKWGQTDKQDILEIMMIFNKYHYNYTFETETRKFIKNIYQSAWLEMNNYLAPMEQVNILASVIYNMYKLSGNSDKIKDADYFFIKQLIEHKSGNQLSLNALYLILCQLLNIPISAIQIPGQFLLAYFDTVYNYLSPQLLPQEKILFYIDANNGMVYTQSDVDAYLKKSNLDVANIAYQQPISNKQFIINYLKKLLKCYTTATLITDKEKEILQLIAALEPTE